MIVAQLLLWSAAVNYLFVYDEMSPDSYLVSQLCYITSSLWSIHGSRAPNTAIINVREDKLLYGKTKTEQDKTGIGMERLELVIQRCKKVRAVRF